MKIHGACHCGRVSFTAEVDPHRVMVCHCTDCQILSGAPYRAVVAAPIETFLLEGTTRSYVKTAESGNKRAQVFCPECGTPICSRAADNATYVMVRLGCVKERRELTPVVQIWKRSALPWLPALRDVPGSQCQEAFLSAPQIKA